MKATLTVLALAMVGAALAARQVVPVRGSVAQATQRDRDQSPTAAAARSELLR